jgi:hypothetical protein
LFQLSEAVFVYQTAHYYYCHGCKLFFAEAIRNNFQHEAAFARLPCIYNINTEQKMQWYYSTPQLNNGHFSENQAVTIVALVAYSRNTAIKNKKLRNVN